MRAIPAIWIIGLVILLPACAPEPPPPLNSPAFNTRPPLPGQPGYLETIRYIDDGLKYTAAGSAFFVAADGEMCFSGPVNLGLTRLVNYQNYWCMSPMTVESVEALRNDVSYVNEVRLWCRHATPQCAHKTGYPNMLDDAWIANSITAEILPFRQEQAAIEHLVYLMGGSVGEAVPLPWRGNAVLDTPPSAASVRALTLATEETR
jgi:hypothetical protein